MEPNRSMQPPRSILDSPQPHSTAQPAWTPSQEAFEAVLDAIPTIRHRRAILGDEPTVVVEGPAEALEKVIEVAQGAGLFPHYTTGLTSVHVHGFGQLRSFASHDYCGRCGGDLMLTRERTSGLCTACAKAVRR